MNSFVGAFGESVPPQQHKEAPWIDEVWQNVGVCATCLTAAEKAGEGKWFIHQAGAYQRDGAYTDAAPFYSPSVAAHCDEHQCTFASWAQQAHTPTKHVRCVKQQLVQPGLGQRVAHASS